MSTSQPPARLSGGCPGSWQPSFVLAFLFIWADGLERLSVRCRPRACCPTTVRRPRAVRDAVGERSAGWVALKNLGIFGLFIGHRHGHRAAAGDPARPEDPRRGRAAHHLPLPDGAQLHRHRHGLEVDPQPRPGPRSHAQWGWTNFRFDWLVDPDMAIYTIVIAGVWQSSGFVMALFLAGLRGIDDSIIKAAQIDGASACRASTGASSSRDAAGVLLTLMVLAHLAIKSFDLVMALTAGGPGYATDVPATFMYTHGLHPRPDRPGRGLGHHDAGHRRGHHRRLSLLCELRSQRCWSRRRMAGVLPMKTPPLAIIFLLLLFAAVLPAAVLRDARDLAEGHEQIRRQPAAALPGRNFEAWDKAWHRAPAPASTAAACGPSSGTRC